MKRLDIAEGAERVANLLRAMTLKIQMLARGVRQVKHSSYQARRHGGLSMEASAICGIPLASTRKVFREVMRCRF